MYISVLFLYNLRIIPTLSELAAIRSRQYIQSLFQTTFLPTSKILGIAIS